MKNLIFIIFGLIFCSCASPEAIFVKSADRFVNNTVGPEYELYVNKDLNLSELDKDIRIKNLEAFRKAVEEAKK